ncbi:hypothetical protein GCM10027296_22930 [Chitinimonas naiadis]
MVAAFVLLDVFLAEYVAGDKEVLTKDHVEQSLRSSNDKIVFSDSHAKEAWFVGSAPVTRHCLVASSMLKKVFFFYVEKGSDSFLASAYLNGPVELTLLDKKREKQWACLPGQVESW